MWGQALAVSSLAEMNDSDSDDKRCLHYLATSLVQIAGHGSQKLVSEFVRQAVDPNDDNGRASAREQLAKIGIGIFEGKTRRAADDGGDGRPRPVFGRTYLMVANAHQGLGRLFAESNWKGKAGASGVWCQSLKRIRGAVPNERQRIGGVAMACTLVPIEAVWGDAVPGEGGAGGVAAYNGVEAREDA
jgi:hypothetical protein